MFDERVSHEISLEMFSRVYPYEILKLCKIIEFLRTFFLKFCPKRGIKYYFLLPVC